MPPHSFRSPLAYSRQEPSYVDVCVSFRSSCQTGGTRLTSWLATRALGARRTREPPKLGGVEKRNEMKMLTGALCRITAAFGLIALAGLPAAATTATNLSDFEGE